MTTGARKDRSLTFAWSRSSTNYTNNTSTISWTLKGSGSASGMVKGGGLYVKINGSVKVDESTDTRYELRNGNTYKSGSATITHNNDGTKSFACEVKAGIYEYARNVSASQTFTLDKLTRTVTYNGNGNTGGSTSSQTKTFGTALALRSNGFTKTGHKFVKWNTKSDGSGTSYNAGASFTSEVASTTIYAIWTKETYSVSFNANGGSGAPSAQTKTYGTALTLSSTKPTRSGWTFVGWGTSATDTTADYQPGGTYNTNGAITLYAIWSKTLTLSYNANGESGAPASQSQTIYNATTSATFTISSTSLTSTSSLFKGWATSSTATSAGYQPSGSISISSNTTLYAVWQKKTYSVTYNLNGGSGSFAAQTKTYGETLTLRSGEPTLAGYLFQGWATSENGDVKYAPGASYTGNAALTLYAVWLVGTKIGFTFAQPSYTIDCDNSCKVILNDLSISYTTKTTSENAALPFWIKPYYKDARGNIYNLQNYGSPTGGSSPNAVGGKGTLVLTANDIKNNILLNNSTEDITFYFDTFTAEQNEEMKATYSISFDAANYTKPKIDYLLLYREKNGEVSVKIQLEFPKSFTNITSKAQNANISFETNNGKTFFMTTDESISNMGNNIIVYTYHFINGVMKGRIPLTIKYTDNLFPVECTSTLAANNADQIFKILRSGASKTMNYVEKTSINGLKIVKDGRAYGKGFTER
jgi:uncharacterized repeat protein (TIGR02543 family)